MKYVCLAYGEEKKNGKVSITDGPFAETKEQLAGFYLIGARDLKEAIQIASKIPPARVGCVEVRPIMKLTGRNFRERLRHSSFMKAARLWKDAKYSALARPALAVLAVSTVAAAATLTEVEKKEGLAQLERTRSGVVEATKGLSDAQWKFKPGPDRWSVAEVLEHIVVTENFLLENTSQKVMQAPAGKADRDYKSTDKLVLSAIADRTQRAQAPEPVRPTGRWSPQEALGQFLKIRERTMEFLKSTPGLRDHVVDSPLGQPLDAYQWLLYISAHSERHTKQVLEVKADPNFPKN